MALNHSSAKSTRKRPSLAGHQRTPCRGAWAEWHGSGRPRGRPEWLCEPAWLVLRP